MRRLSIVLLVGLAACGDDGGKSKVDAGGDCAGFNDNNECTTDSCNGDTAVHTNVTDGTTCGAGTCTGGVCSAGAACNDGMMNGDETDIDCGGSCAPTTTCADQKMCGAGTDCTSGVCIGMICQVPDCGDGILQPGEMCDDGNNINGDGCDDGVLGTCRATGCGNGTVAGTEVCDDGNAVEGDGCDNNCTTSACGNGVTAGTEGCDDGNTDVGDGCDDTCTAETGYSCTMASPAVCTTVCGDGIVAGTEQCDDNNMADGDGCSAACVYELNCPAGSTKVTMANTTATPIPDNMVAGVTSTVTLATAGAVTKLFVVNNLTHTYDGDLTISLQHRSGSRALSIKHGGTDENYTGTVFDDLATTTIATGTAPFTGPFKPDASMATTAGADFAGTNAAGDWGLHIVDDANADTGTLLSWTLVACVDTTATYCGDNIVNGAEECDDGNAVDTDACDSQCHITDGCGDGNIDAGEQCDDNNLANGDGCSATCQFAMTCGAGETPVIVTNANPFAIPDNLPAGVSSPVTVATAGAVKKIVVLTNLTHTADGNIDMSLKTARVTRELSTDNGLAGDNFAGTTFSDAATALVTAGTSPFTGTYKPEQSLASDAVTDFTNQNAAGTWNLFVADDTATDTGSITSWTLGLCVNTTAPFCGNGTTNAGEQCDDGNTVNNDSCTNNCQIVTLCGNGAVDGAGETCDDGNQVAGDGCSATCGVEITCVTGSPVVVNGTGAFPIAIPDGSTTGASSPATIATVGTVTKAIVTLTIAHGYDADVDISLASPMGTILDISSDNGDVNDNYTSTIFDDAATTSIADVAALPPYRGRFKPEMPLSGLNGQPANGTWTLKAVDDDAIIAGTLVHWSLALCVQ